MDEASAGDPRVNAVKASEQAQPSSRKWWLLGLGALLIVAAVGVSALNLLPARSDASVVTVLGTEYTTNQSLADFNGRAYMTILVNTPVSEVVFESEYPQDTYEFQRFLESLDTLVPGEFVVQLSTGELRVIVDGMYPDNSSTP